MRKYLAVYMASVSADEMKPNDISEDMRRKGMQAWGRWVEENSNSIVDFGGPLGKTKRASSSGIEDHVNNLTGYVVIEAESHESAAELFKNHPHFAIFPGDAVEIMECLDIPQN